MTATEVAAARDERARRVLSNVDLNGVGLEIGPSYNPLLPKSSGARIEIVDHATRDELTQKYRGYGLAQEELDRIEDVDHIATSGSLVETIGRPGGFDFILASHVIEHSVDLIAFLQDCEALLKEGGRVALAVPDQRFCFDLFKPRSSVGAVLDAHLRPTAFHTPGALLDHTAYACTRNGQIAWSPEETGPLGLQFPTLSGAQEVIDQGVAQDEYHDVHRWTFTPSSFALLIHDLRSLGHHSLHQVPSGPPPLGFEFFVALEKKATPHWSVDRLELVQAAMAEAAVVHRDFDVTRAVDAETLHQERARRVAAEQELAQARAEVTALRSSTSWRVTAPVRLAVTAARASRTRIRRGR